MIDASEFRNYVVTGLGWTVASVLLVLGYVDTTTKSEQMMQLLKDNIATRIEILAQRDILPRAEREIAALSARIEVLQTKTAIHETYDNRLAKVEDDISSRTNQRWNLPDQIKWVEELRSLNPDMKVPASKPITSNKPLP